MRNIFICVTLLPLATLLIPSQHISTSAVLDFLNCNSTEPVFECESVKGPVCVSVNSLCNGIPECPEGQDETVAQCGCLANEFRCSNTCVALVKRCDRHLDCDSGEDEQDCNTYLCPVTHFKCNNHFCIPLDAVCDFKDDCGDNSDEQECPHRPCWNLEFRCDNGECIRPGSLCDGQPDCVDGSDEKDCSPDAFVKCGDGRLVHKYYWCDDWPDCPDNHADELHCRPCRVEEFQCPNGRCIRQANVCDAQCDCVLGHNSPHCADEVDCANFYTVTDGVIICKPGVSLGCKSVPTASSGNDKDRCIRQEFLCDGYNDCHNGNFLSDEFGCNRGMDLKEDVFHCLDNRTLPLWLHCDFKADCLHGDDETNCTVVICGDGEFTCANGQCVSLESRCDVTLDCLDKSDELNCHMEKCRDGYIRCEGSGQCVPQHQWCDHFVDCPDESDEPPHCGYAKCKVGEFQCSNGQCIDAALRCFNSGNDRTGCADKSHLADCSNWECTAEHFKCHLGPCINISLQCDSAINCQGFWNDEDGCPFTCSATTPQCECRDIHINCTGRNITSVPTDAELEITWFHLGSNQLNGSLTNQTFLHLDRLLYLDLSNNSLHILPPLLFDTLWRLSVLDLRNNLLTRLGNGPFTGLASLKLLHLHGNNLQILESMAFYGLTSLKMLDLRGQKIQSIEPGSFVGLRSLTGLDLSDNKITYIEQGTFRGLLHLLFLDISGNQISVIEANVFRSTSALNKLVTDEFRFCCLARHARVCLPPPDEFSSCEDLMSNLVLRLCVWLLAGVATVGNILVIIWRSRYSHCNQVHSFLITNLALGDLLMGSYLLVIALVDCHYRGVYFIHDSTWRASKLCALAGFLSTFSSELSVFTLTVITLDRFLAIIFPFRVRRLEMARTRRLMAVGWLLAVVLSALPLSRLQYFHNFYGRSGVCLALHITPDKPSGWEYSVFVFLFLNLVSFSVIAVGYVWMFFAARTTHLAVTRDRRSTESAMAWRMSLLVVTDAACWVPIIVLGLASLAGFTVPPQVFAWVAVFVLPLNAALNPLLYTLSTAPFLTPARHGLLTFRRSCKLSSSTYMTTRHFGSGRSDGSTCYTITKRVSVRWQTQNPDLPAVSDSLAMSHLSP